MSVYERNYKPYLGERTATWSRFLVIPHYAYSEVFKNRLFISFLVACFVWPLALGVMIYLPHNASVLKLLQQSGAEGLFSFSFNATFFLSFFMVPQGIMAFIAAFIVGPALISADLRNNALPLYFSRPFNRWEYIGGKALVLMNLLSLITWIPGMLLFLLQSYLVGEGWFSENYRIGIAIFLASWIYILLLCLVSLSLSAYVKWKPVARLGLFGVFVLSTGMATMLNVLLRTNWGSLIDLPNLMRIVWSDLFGVRTFSQLPVGVAWLMLVIACVACIALLSRKVRPFEVVK